MARHTKYPRRPRRVASERLYTGGTRSVASALERRCSACADLAKTDVATTPGIPGYATIGLCQGAGICAAPRGREGRAPARPVAHHHGPAREVPAPPSARGVRTAVYGRDALRRVRLGTQMLRMRRFGKDRCGYDARDTGLRHNRSLPRCRNLCGPAWAGGTRSCAIGCPPTWPGTGSTRAALGAWRCGVSPTDPVLGDDGPLFIKCGQGPTTFT